MKLHTVPEAAKTLGLTYNRLYYYLVTQYREPAVACGRTRLLSDDDLEKIKNYFLRRANRYVTGETPTT